MSPTFFAPQLFIPGGVNNIDFYGKAFGAVILRSFMNDDGSIHVAELSINGALFHIHESSAETGKKDPIHAMGTTVLVGLFVPDTDSVMNNAVAAGGIVISPAQDYFYGYRQGEIKDPFGHHWLIQQRIG